MKCHMQKAAHHACETEPREFACCALSQHAYWLQVASILNDLIVEAYGETCGTKQLTDEAIEQRFAHRFGAISPPSPGLRGTAERTANVVLAWALRGVCGTQGDCVVPLSNVTDVRKAELNVLRQQGDLAWVTLLTCASEVNVLR